MMCSYKGSQTVWNIVECKARGLPFRNYQSTEQFGRVIRPNAEISPPSNDSFKETMPQSVTQSLVDSQ